MYSRLPRFKAIAPSVAPFTTPSPTSQPRAYALASLALLTSILALGAAWHHGHWNWYAEDEIGLYAGDVGQPVCLEAVATTETSFFRDFHPFEALREQDKERRLKEAERVIEAKGG